MRVIPVIDVKAGQVVHAVAGQRHCYQPIRSCLVDTPRPAQVAQAFTSRGFDELYLADLDALQGGAIQWDAIHQVLTSGARLWLDVGLRSVPATRDCHSRCGDQLAALIVALETVADPKQLSALLEAADPDRVAFSLDLRDGRPVCRPGTWSAGEADAGEADAGEADAGEADAGEADAGETDAPAVAATAVAAGVQRMIVLDIAAVGTGAGVPTGELCRRLRLDYPHLELVTGGGVRQLADLDSLHAAGCDAVLVASALHDGRISIERLRQAGYAGV